jgi:hypothetical protein
VAIQSTFNTVFTAEPSAFAVVPSPSRDVVDLSSQLAASRQANGRQQLYARLGGPTPLGSGYQGDSRGNQEQQLCARLGGLTPLDGGYQGDQ